MPSYYDQMRNGMSPLKHSRVSQVMNYSSFYNRFAMNFCAQQLDSIRENLTI